MVSRTGLFALLIVSCCFFLPCSPGAEETAVTKYGVTHEKMAGRTLVSKVRVKEVDRRSSPQKGEGKSSGSGRTLGEAPAVPVEQQCPARRRALIDREDIGSGHVSLPSAMQADGFHSAAIMPINPNGQGNPRA